VLFGVSVVVFLMMKLIPGDPPRPSWVRRPRTEKIEMVRKSLGLDQPFYVQYFRWLWKVLQGDFGSSIAVNVPVAQLVWPKFWNTVLLTAGSLVICVIVGLGVGIVSGTRQYSWFDRLQHDGDPRPGQHARLLARPHPQWSCWRWRAGVVPGHRDVLHAGRREDDARSPAPHVLPAITTAAVSGRSSRVLVRSSFLDVIRKNFVIALRAKGLSERDIILRPRPAQRHAADHQHHGAADRVPDGRGALHRGRVLVAGHRAADLQLDRRPDLPVVQAAVLVTTFVFVLVNLGTGRHRRRARPPDPARVNGRS